ncbi:trypsin-like peptidase domain-containing protein [Dolichospermum circinale]|uniref:trypsin-like peptidase domain-containing protein n=1 Tax=Dolichospermum circinale TaxID=109265 RepID=UPI00232D3D70|nr:trypsin-like peptidase domain-containing protein [Dolichospermum circinale]MDB9454125.1 trypsin-like peptidase domain-containing protein [Dolichospermum circinale CS-541/06]MDB9463773.1 trypsin-like peptidase domain-containing protein [Dolichospermum circinale CS-541/04]
MTYTNESYKTRIARIYTSADENVINVVGAGFLISDQYIVTCAHVVADALRIDHTTQDKPLVLIKLDFPFLTGGNKQNSGANILLWKPRSNSDYSYYSYGEDIAVLELSEKLPTNNITFQLSLADITNHPFSVVGFPEGNDPGIITKGKLLGAVGDKLGLVQMEVEHLSLPYIEPGFSGAPVWDEDLKSFVGIVVSSELDENGEHCAGLRRNVKVGYMIPAKIILESWSFFNLINILTANLDTHINYAIEIAYKACSSRTNIPTTVEAIVKDLYDLDKRNLDSNEKFNHKDNVGKFIKYLITKSHIPQSKLEDLKKWGRNNIEDFDKLIQDVNQQYQNTDTKPESYILIKIEPLGTKSRSKIPKFKISGGVIPNIQNYIRHQTEFNPISFSNSPDDSFTLDSIEKVFCSLFQKIPCKLESQIKFVFFLPPEYLNHPVETWKIDDKVAKNDNKKLLIPVGRKYPVMVRDVSRLESTYLNIHEKKWIDNWKELEKITCNNFKQIHEYNEEKFTLLMINKKGIILNIFDENNKNDNKITKIFDSLMSNAVPVAICHRDKITLDIEEYKSKVNNELNCCIHTLPNHLMQKYLDYLENDNQYLFVNNVFLIYENPHILPYKPEPIITN